MKDSFSFLSRLSVVDAYCGYCCVTGCTNLADEAHHALPNTKTNNKKYPLFVNSVFNMRPVCREHHESYTSHPELRVSERLATVYEQALEEAQC